MANFELTLHFFNGSREPLKNRRVTVSAINGRGRFLGTQQTDKESLTLALPLSGDFIADQFTLNASAKGYRDAGHIGVRPAGGFSQGTLHLMLMEREARILFRKPAEWPPEWREMKEKVGAELIPFGEKFDLRAACLLNVLEAIRLLPEGGRLLRAMQRIPCVAGNEQSRGKREEGILQDRALLNVDADMEAAVKEQEGKGLSKASGAAHGAPQPDETVTSFKEDRFPEANLQFTFFKNQKRLYADIDMDYFRDGFSHGIFELFPNTVFGSRTDPRKIYALRWMASRNSGSTEFAPPYVLAT